MVYIIGVVCSCVLFSNTLPILAALSIMAAFIVNTVCGIWHIILLGMTVVMLKSFNEEESSAD